MEEHTLSEWFLIICQLGMLCCNVRKRRDQQVREDFRDLGWGFPGSLQEKIQGDSKKKWYKKEGIAAQP